MYITKKRINGHVYYYAVISQRIDGKPRTVWQKYLGKVEDIVQRADSALPQPVEAQVFDFGAIAALWEIARRLNLVEIIDAHVPKRRQGGSVGQYILIAAINRLLEPSSKAHVGEWFETTALRRLLPHVRATDLSSQHFWNHMDRLEETLHIRHIEQSELAEHMIREFNLDLRTVIYDTTNFISYIDSANPAALPQRGKSKEKRFDLRIVGLAMMVTLDFHIPLFHHVYPGNRHDSKELDSITEELLLRYLALSQHCEEVTVVYDKGNNADSTMRHLDESPYHIVGSLVPSQHLDLLRIPLDDYRELDGDWAGHKAFRTRKKVLGAERTVVLVYNEALYLGQMQGISVKLKKAAQALRKLSQKLDRHRQGKVQRGKRPTLESTQREVKRILSGEQLDRLIHCEVDVSDELPSIRFRVDHAALHELAAERFGKTLLFSTQDEWTDEAIIRAYRGQAAVEDGFSAMKNAKAVAWHPMFHWTDSKIRVHAFYCVLALTLASLLRREVIRRAQEKGINVGSPSISTLLTTLNRVKEVAHLYPPESGVKPQLALSRMTPEQRCLYDLLDLENYVEPSVLREHTEETP